MIKLELDEKIESGTGCEKGATMVEYALMVALIAVVCIVAITRLGRTTSNTFNSVTNSIGAVN